jgi:large subunit ribosomal protein L20
MTKSHRAVGAAARHKKIIKLAKGYRSRAKNCFVVAVEKVEKALRYAYRDRRAKKRDFRGLWIQRINAAVREHGMIYSQFIGALKVAGVDLNRKMLSQMAVRDPEAFKKVVEIAKKHLDKKEADKAA